MTDLFGLPKAELHLHIEGTLEPELAFALARRNKIAMPFGSVEELRAAYRFQNLSSFLDVYYAAMACLRTEDDFADLARAYLDRAAAQGVRHAEIFFDPQAHLGRGVPLEAVIDGLTAALAEAERDHGISGGLILCFLRDMPAAEADAVLTAALPRRADLLGVGLDSAEVGNPPERFAEVFRRAREAGLRAVAHAGEEAPPEYVWQALDLLGVERIDHGIRAVEDAALVDRLAAEAVPLTVCPLSNVRLKAVADLAAHPLPELIERGVAVTINSDDPAYFGGYIGDNFKAVADQFGLSPDAAATLARTSFTASFLEPARERVLLAEVDAWEAAQA
ncbi:adenosine deaminase [Actinocorallia sp. A-T 12471]|uniref:adenosine deaminase n=1 Tax=Actinocorallia sp. A-T 12471 TaxID=3089813 RepID=UPI0029CEED82|nr:adenosine deaminase [Actinocorallia sp. A-T 12471]MDX6742325.1 adenosine deaminase [Actinocorallia sp. A-T 12471]